VVTRPLHTDPLEGLSTSELLRQVLDETKELARLEIRLAQQELREDVKRLKWAGVLLGVAGALFVVALAMFDVAVVFALGGTATAALIVAFIVLAQVAIVGFLGYRQLPKVPLGRTRARLVSEVRELKEHVK
jgi:uncharacterized membrane protein YqjE